MRKKIAVVITVMAFAAFAAFGATSALAGSDNHSEPGVPGEANCVGQTMAYLAQGAASLGAPGIGNLASFDGVTVQQIKAIVDDYCAGSG